MKMSKMLRMLFAGLFFAFVLAACAGSDAMARDKMMHEEKTDRMDMEKGKMETEDDTMMKDASQSESMMTSDTMKSDTMKDDKNMEEKMEGGTMMRDQ